MGRVQQLLREGKKLPPDAAVDADGKPTTDPAKAVALIPFGAHKGYGLSLLNEIVGAFIGGSLPTIRCRPHLGAADEKRTPCFFFQVIHPEAMSANAFAQGRTQAGNVKAVLADLLGHGNESAKVPGQMEHEWSQKCARNGGLLFSAAEVSAFNELAQETGLKAWDIGKLPVAVK
jgi:L-2-hydroxycarboxylate dehydrogenase (NAD+)